MNRRLITLAGCLVFAATAFAQSAPNEAAPLQEYVIEREIPGAGKLGPAELKAIARKSNSVLASMGPNIQWVRSFVTGNKLYCVYRADSEDAIRKHAATGGFPANRISLVTAVIDPTTGY